MKKYVKGFLACLKNSKVVITKSRNADAGRVWLTVKDFVCEGKYSAYKKAGSLAELSLGGYGDSYIAAHLGISENTVRVHRRDISNELYKLFGDDFFDLLNDFSNNEQEVKKRIKVVQTSNLRAEDVLPLEIVALVKNTEAVDLGYINLSDCKSELSFFKKHCKADLLKAVSALDANKLQYIIGIINNDCGSPADRYTVLNILTQQEEK